MFYILFQSGQAILSIVANNPQTLVTYSNLGLCLAQTIYLFQARWALCSGILPRRDLEGFTSEMEYSKPEVKSSTYVHIPISHNYSYGFTQS